MRRYRLTVLIGIGKNLRIRGKEYDKEAKLWEDACYGSKDQVTDRAMELLKEGRYKGMRIYMIVRWKKNHKGKFKQDKVWRIE